MIEEIIYTSAEKGLKAGSRGFCTVVSTAGMAINTAERLESMSGYRHAFPMQDPKAVLNPVNYSHVTLRIGGKNAHVISRVADAGQDYSGRTNKLAHHLMFDDVSRMTAGPARLMAEKGVLVSQWDGHVKTVPARNLPMPTSPQSIELKAWKQVTGDSGWAGWVAEQLTKDKPPVSVIFQPGTDTLLLVREVLDLLPVTQQWSITFCTYFTKLLAGTECQLRFVLHDTPEATALRNDARARVVDLTARLPECSGGALIQAARSGQIQAARPSETVPIASPAVSRGSTTVRSDDRQIATRPAAEIPAIPKATAPDISITNAVDRRIPSLRTFDTIRAPQKRSRAVLYSALALALIVISAVGFAIYANRAANPDAIAKTTPQKPVAPAAPPGNENANDKTAPRETDSFTADTREETAPESAPAKEEKKNGSASDQDSLLSAKAISDPTTVVLGEQQKLNPTEQKNDPFRLIHADKRFNYPNHSELKLFSFTPRPIKIEAPPIPLVLENGDRVELALHASFQRAISASGREVEIRLVKESSSSAQEIWTAQLVPFQQTPMAFCQYLLQESRGTDATHLLTFIPKALATNGNSEEIKYANLFRFCPLVVSIKSKSGDDRGTIVLAQRTGRLVAAEDNKGTRHSQFEKPNDFYYLPLVSPKKHFQVVLEIVTQSDTSRERVVNSIEFDGKEATGDLYLRLDSGEVDLKFHENWEAADGDSGHVRDRFAFSFSVDDDEKAKKNANTNVVFQFSASRTPEARFLLPWMQERSGKTAGSEELGSALDKNVEDFKPDGEEAKRLTSLQSGLELRFRLPLSTLRKDAIDSNCSEFQKMIDDVLAQLTLQTVNQTAALNAEQKKDAKDQMEAVIKMHVDNLKRISDCKALIEPLAARYDQLQHDKQYAGYKKFLERDAERLFGYEVAIKLPEANVDGFIHPATSVYLIETFFPEVEQ